MRAAAQAVALAAFIVAVSAQVAFAASTGRADAPSPIRIDGCRVNVRTYLVDPFNSQRVNDVSGIAVRFVNVGALTAIRAELGVEYGGSTQQAAVSGTFLSGRSIERTVGAFAGTTYTSASAACRIRSVLFADGSAWNAAAP